MQRIRTHRPRQFENLRQLVRIVAGNCRIDLYRHAQFLEIAKAGNGRIESAGNSPETVVGNRICAVEADCNTLYTALDNFARDGLRNQSTVRGQRRAQAFFGGVASQFEYVLTKERFTSAQHKNGVGHFGNLVDNFFCEIGRKIGGRAEFRSAGTAMNATEIASFRQLPKYQAWLVWART